MIPKDWSEINIKQFIKLYPTFNTEGMTDSEIVDNKIKQLSIIKDISLEDAENCTVVEANKVKLLLETPLPKKIVKYFKLHGITYEFNTDANRLNTTGYVGVANAIKEDPIKNMNVSLFNLATPVKYSWLRARWIPYEFKNHEVGDRMRDFLDLPVSVGYPIAFFFSNLLESLTEDMEDYLSKSMKEAITNLENAKQDLQDMAGQLQ